MTIKVLEAKQCPHSTTPLIAKEKYEASNDINMHSTCNEHFSS
jgi:hypothetical protein